MISCYFNGHKHSWETQSQCNRLPHSNTIYISSLNSLFLSLLYGYIINVNDYRHSVWSFMNAGESFMQMLLLNTCGSAFKTNIWLRLVMHYSSEWKPGDIVYLNTLKMGLANSLCSCLKTHPDTWSCLNCHNRNTHKTPQRQDFHSDAFISPSILDKCRQIKNYTVGLEFRPNLCWSQASRKDSPNAIALQHATRND